jgi:hypothetical protein
MIMLLVEVDHAVAPAPTPPASAEQITLPDASVVSLPLFPRAEQLKAERRRPEPETRRSPASEVVAEPVTESSFTRARAETKSEVEVALVVVALVAVKFWKVEEPVARKLRVWRYEEPKEVA